MAKLSKAEVLKKAEQLKNWGRWGPDDEWGVLNFITPQDIVNAARLVRKGKVFRLGLELDENGPQRGIFGGRWNPLHQMLATGTDAVAGKHDVTPGLRYADDAINLPTQAATQWWVAASSSTWRATRACRICRTGTGSRSPIWTRRPPGRASRSGAPTS